MLRCFVFTGFSSALWSLLPLVAKRMAGSASTYGLLLGALGVGALLGAGMIGWMRHNWGLRRLFAAATFAVALTVLALAAVPSIYFLLPVLALGGFGWMVALSTFNVVVQLAAAQNFRGRAISVYYIALFGGLALGSWAWGHVAEAAGVDWGLYAARAGLLASLSSTGRALQAGRFQTSSRQCEPPIGRRPQIDTPEAPADNELIVGAA